MSNSDWIRSIFSRRWVRHVAFWCVVYMAMVVLYATSGNADLLFGQLLFKNLSRMPAILLASYSFNYWLIPAFYRNRYYLLFTLLFLLSAYFFSVMDRAINIYINETLFRVGEYQKETARQLLTQIGPLVQSYFPRIYLVTLVVTLIKTSGENARVREENLQLEKEKASSELNLLKAQLHPHFLFNTLNNIYALATIKSDKTAAAVAQLSEILDYTVYGNRNEVTLEKELEVIENYVELERLRYGDRLDFRFLRDIQDPSFRISPVLLLSLVENAFKHGGVDGHERFYVHVRLKVNLNRLEFVVENSVSQGQKMKQGGVGNKNLKRQLELLYNHHSLEMRNTGKVYGVTLVINREEI